MDKVKVTIKVDNRDATLKEFRKKCEMAMNAVGARAETHSKEYSPVDTGRLRNSIAHDNDWKGKIIYAYIGTNVEYAPFVEFRPAHHPVGRMHYLRDGAADHIEEYIKIIKTTLDS